MKSEPAITSFARHAASMIPEGREGISITVVRSPEPGSTPVVQGMCRIADETAKTMSDTILHNVTIVCTFGPTRVPFAFSVAQEEAVFPEDILIGDGYQTAFFTLDLGRYGLPAERGRYYVLASFHTFLSDVVELSWGR